MWDALFFVLRVSCWRPPPPPCGLAGARPLAPLESSFFVLCSAQRRRRRHLVFGCWTSDVGCWTLTAARTSRPPPAHTFVPLRASPLCVVASASPKRRI